MDENEILYQAGRAAIEQEGMVVFGDTFLYEGVPFCSKAVMELCEDPSLVLFMCDLCRGAN
jgi:hypothetical protein